MSVDTRTPRTAPGGNRGGFQSDDAVLNTVKVPCDPAQVIVNHASFRVDLGSSAPVGGPLASAAMPGVGAGPARGRRAVVVSGRSAAGGAAMGDLLASAVGSGGPGPDGVATQVLPRITDTAVVPSVVGPRGPSPGEMPDERRRPAGGGTGPGPEREPAGGPPDTYVPSYEAEAGAEPQRGGGGREAFYPGRNLQLGIVLLPLRLLLGFICVSAGFAKLTDPVYFDGGDRGSMVSWLSGLEPWAMAAPLHEWALTHPVGAGLTVAFAQIIAGVLTIAGLWQRAAAVLGALLSLALLMTVSWTSGPAYDAPDIILFAAWTPLIIAGAPVYSLDARLHGEAWRTLGPHAGLSELRGRVLRRGVLLACLLLGVTLLLGSLLGGAVRSAQPLPRPEPGDSPRNYLPGQPLPERETDAEEADAPGAARPEPPEPSAEPSEPAEEPSAEVPEEAAPAAPQPAPAPVPSTQPPPADEGAGGGTGGEEPPPQEQPPAEDEGGDGSSLGPLGGLLG